MAIKQLEVAQSETKTKALEALDKKIKAKREQVKKYKAEGMDPNVGTYLETREEIDALMLQKKKIQRHTASTDIPAVARLKATAANWWDELTPAQKKEYIKGHPNSKYAKPAGKTAVTPTPTGRPAPPKAKEETPAERKERLYQQKVRKFDLQEKKMDREMKNTGDRSKRLSENLDRNWKAMQKSRKG